MGIGDIVKEERQEGMAVGMRAQRHFDRGTEIMCKMKLHRIIYRRRSEQAPYSVPATF
jgi:hypothetical protein